MAFAIVGDAMPPGADDVRGPRAYFNDADELVVAQRVYPQHLPYVGAHLARPRAHLLPLAQVANAILRTASGRMRQRRTSTNGGGGSQGTSGFCETRASTGCGRGCGRGCSKASQ